MPQDRLRLKLRPPTTGVPQGFGDLYFNEDGALMKQTQSGGSEEVGGSLSASLNILGVPTYTNLTAANAALTIGSIFYNTALAKLDITTA